MAETTLRESNPLARIEEVRRMLRQHSIGSRTMGEDGYPLHAWVEDVAAALELKEAMEGAIDGLRAPATPGPCWCHWPSRMPNPPHAPACTAMREALGLAAPAPAGERSEG